MVAEQGMDWAEAALEKICLETKIPASTPAAITPAIANRSRGARARPTSVAAMHMATMTAAHETSNDRVFKTAQN